MMPTLPAGRSPASCASLAILMVLGFGDTRAASPPTFDDAFWRLWGDGQAEICTYDLVYPRYGANRGGLAVTIFVTETFSHEDRVKADPGEHPRSDEVPVMKLNLVQDFATGVYDYNLMTSTFVQLAERDRRPAGSTTKVAFSGQEWCGQVFHQLLPEKRKVRSILHSYFDGEADRTDRLPYPKDALFEDALFHWARGWATPVLAPGDSRDVKLLRSTELSRMKHLPTTWEDATLRRASAATEATIPLGTFDVIAMHAEVRGRNPRTWTFDVEVAPPHRIIRWQVSDGRGATLVQSTRTAYWALNSPEGIDALPSLGLSPRGARTP